ncbi:uncharacterized protein ACO6RY_16316 [Pungitius sinensis]
MVYSCQAGGDKTFVKSNARPTATMSPKAPHVQLPVSTQIQPKAVLFLTKRAASAIQATSSVLVSASLMLSVAAALRVATTARE